MSFEYAGNAPVVFFNPEEVVAVGARQLARHFSYKSWGEGVLSRDEGCSEQMAKDIRRPIAAPYSLHALSIPPTGFSRAAAA